MAYEMVMPYHLHMPSYFLETFTEYPLLRQAINELPPQRQRIFKLSWENNLSHKEIAEQLGVSINTVQQHISLSLKFIRHFFNKNAELNWIVILFLSIYK